MSSNTKSTKLAQSQSGMVAIFITMLIIIIISLIVLGFAQISRRNQRNTLDTQLSTQAFYAADSGVNDAFNEVQKKIVANVVPLPGKTTCGDDINYNFNGSGKSTLSSGVTYTCVLINPTPPSLTYKIGAQGVVIPLISGSVSPLQTITLTWTPEVGQEAASIAGCYAPANLGKFPNASGPLAWGCKYAALHIELLDAAVLSRAIWQANTITDVLEPINTATNTSMPAATTDGQAWPATCTDVPLTCRVTITGLAAASHYMRVSAIYRTTNLTITGTTATGPATFSGAQVKIDVTGKAQDVLRRILVSLDLSDANSTVKSNAALSVADSVCKRFSVTTGSFSNENYAGGGGNNLCQAANVGTPSP